MATTMVAPGLDECITSKDVLAEALDRTVARELLLDGRLVRGFTTKTARPCAA